MYIHVKRVMYEYVISYMSKFWNLWLFTGCHRGSCSSLWEGEHPHFSSLASSANHLQINQRILSRQKSNEMYVITSGGRSLTQQISLYVGGGRGIFNLICAYLIKYTLANAHIKAYLLSEATSSGSNDVHFIWFLTRQNTLIYTTSAFFFPCS